MTDVWRSGGTDTLAIDPAAVEAEGWHGQMFMDSQSLGGDPYALMGSWAARTSTLHLSTGVTNPLTRHPAVTAAAIATVHAVSGGRAVLGIGRGDSALAYLGYAPAPTRRFETALTRIRTLLRGGEIAFGDDELAETAVSAEQLELGDRPTAARLGWLPADLPAVEVDVAATGPRVIDIAARVADRVTFSVGAEPERLGWAIDRARATAADAGRATPSFGAQLVVVCHRDPSAVREAAAKLVLPLARFQIIAGGGAAGPGGAADAEHYDAVRRGYAMTKHSDFDGEKLVGETLDPGFVDRFAIVGTPEQCAERLLALAAIGLDRFVVFGPGFHDDGERGASLFSREVLPILGGGTDAPRRPAGNDDRRHDMTGTDVALAALEARIRDLEDHRELVRLTIEYGQAADAGDAARAAGMFGDDGVFDAGPGLVMVGRDGVAEHIDDARHQASIAAGCAHILSMPVVHIAGDVATSTCYTQVCSGDGGVRLSRVSANRWRWRREADGWRVTERIARALDGDPEAPRLLADPADG